MATTRLLCFLTLLTALGVSCTSTKSSTYFYNMKDTTVSASGADFEYNLKKNDILSIQITSLSEDASKIFNTNNSIPGSLGNMAQYSGYLISADGYIQLPLIGNVKAAGISKKQLRENITQIILDKKLLIEPIVNIRHLNFEVTVLGDVGKPSVITIPNEQITLIKALGMAGDITIYGNRDNVLLIRESDGKKTIRRINLNDSRFLVSSPYYYLQPNDVIYVESNKDRVSSVSRNRIILPSVLSALSIFALVADRIIRK